MNRVVTVPARTADFQRVFVAMRYYLGARGPELTAPLEAVGLQAATADLVRGLSAPERSARAQALGVELGLLATALEQRSLTR